MSLKRFFPILLMVAVAILVAECGNKGTKEEKEDESAVVAEDLHLHYIQVSVEGMTCTGCENTVKGVVAKIDGVNTVTASFADSKVLAGYAAATPDTALIREAIISAGYKVRGFTLLGHDLSHHE
jgi:copper chaperone CopZ